MSEELELIIGPDGSVQSIYSDALVDVFGDAPMTTRRASAVEPVPGGWSADLAPVGGPVLGPFRRRTEALAAEVRWLRAAMAEGRVK